MKAKDERRSNWRGNNMCSRREKGKLLSIMMRWSILVLSDIMITGGLKEWGEFCGGWSTLVELEEKVNGLELSGKDK